MSITTTTFKPGDRVEAHPSTVTATTAMAPGDRFGTVYAVQTCLVIEEGDADTVILVTLDTGRPARFPPELLLSAT